MNSKSSPASPRTPALLLTSVLWLLGPGTAGAASSLDEPLVTDRPDFTESTDTLPPGHGQLEGGVTLTEIDGDDTTSWGELLLRIGLHERWELRLESGSYAVLRPRGAPSVEGLEDAAIGFKVRLVDARGRRPALSLLGATSLPTGDSELSSSSWQPSGLVAAAWELSPRLSLGANGGLEYASEEGERFGRGSASVALGFAASDRLGLYAELYGFSRETPRGDPTLTADGGVTFLLSDDAQLDARIGRRLVAEAGGEGENLVGVGFAWRW